MNKHTAELHIEAMSGRLDRRSFLGRIGDLTFTRDDVESLHGLYATLFQQELDSKSVEILSALLKTSLSIQELLAQEAICRLRHEIRLRRPNALELHGGSYFSQSDEDGCIAEIFRRIGVTSKKFFEFGVGAGIQNNTLALLCGGWSGAWIECNKKKYSFIASSFAKEIAASRLQISGEFLNKDNICSVAHSLHVDQEFDLLSVDVDGNDYWLLEALLKEYHPRVIVAEFNGALPEGIEYVQPYDAGYEYHPGSYLGCSLEALSLLCVKHGYVLVGTGIIGINCFFVKADYASYFDCAGDLRALRNIPRYNLDVKGALSKGPALSARRLLDSII